MKNSFWRLFAAYGVDAVLSRVVFCAPLVLAFYGATHGKVLVCGYLVMFALEVLYYACLDGWWGHTLGKWLFKMKVSVKDGERPSFFRALGAYSVDFLLLKPVLGAIFFYFALKGIFWHYPHGNNFVLSLAFIVPVGLECLYFAVCETRFACSLGKRIFGLRVRSEKK